MGKNDDDSADSREELFSYLFPKRYAANPPPELGNVEKRKSSDQQPDSGSDPSTAKRSKILPNDVKPQEVQSSVTKERPDPTKHHVIVCDQARVKCMPTHQVEMASRLVGQMLKVWPEAAPGTHLQVAASLEKFARQVFFPYLVVHQTDPTKPMDQTRVFYATLLALREVLAQNGSKIFKIPSYQGSPIEKSLFHSDDEDERDFLKLMMATTVVMNACEAAGMDSKAFMDVIEEDNFPIAKPFGNTVPVEPNGRKKGEYEAMAWKIGYNYAQKKRQGAVLPLPTSCWISIVEEIPKDKLEKLDKLERLKSDVTVPNTTT